MKFFQKIVCILSLAFVLMPTLSNSQITNPQNDPNIVLTWQASSFVPPDYQGQALPTASTPFVAALELIDEGKFANLGQSDIQWYVNGNLKQSGKNLKSFRYGPPVTNSAVDGYALKVKISNYKNSSRESTVVIPIVHPDLVIDVPYPNKEVVATSSIWTAFPYFFDVLTPSDLSFSWTANGETVDQPTVKDRIILDLSSATKNDQLNIAVSARFEEKLELATAFTNITVK